MPRGQKFKAEEIIAKLREAEVELARGTRNDGGWQTWDYLTWQRTTGTMYRPCPRRRCSIREHIASSRRDFLSNNRAAHLAYSVLLLARASILRHIVS